VSWPCRSQCFGSRESLFRKRGVTVSVYERWLGGELAMSESSFRKQRVHVSRAGSPCFGLWGVVRRWVGHVGVPVSEAESPRFESGESPFRSMGGGYSHHGLRPGQTSTQRVRKPTGCTGPLSTRRCNWLPAAWPSEYVHALPVWDHRLTP